MSWIDIEKESKGLQIIVYVSETYTHINNEKDLINFQSTDYGSDRLSYTHKRIFVLDFYNGTYRYRNKLFFFLIVITLR